MADFFDPSPRASKRRKTTYTASRSILKEKRNEQDEGSLAEDDNQTYATQKSKKQDEDNGDSTYGSKDDTVMESDESPNENHVVGSEPANKTNTASPIDEDIRPTRSRKRGKTKIPTSYSNIEKVANTNPERESGVGESNEHHNARHATPPTGSVESEEETVKDSDTIQIRSSGRERRRPRRYSASPEKPKSRRIQPTDEVRQMQAAPGSTRGKKSPVVKTTPRGILTPSRKEKRPGPRKSVVFDQDEQDIGEQFGFRDIGSSTEKKSSAKTARSKKGSTSKASDTVATPTKEPISHVTGPPPEHEVGEEFDEILGDASIDHYQPEILDVDYESTSAGNFEIDDDPSLLTIKSEVLTRLSFGGSYSVSSHLQNQYDTLHSLLHATIASGESNSLLLLGARGSGKSHIVEAAISDLSKQFIDDFHTVRLSGFLQTDDKVALREIWRQLGREMQVSDMETGELGGSYADTMASLLSLLSHPDEFGEPAPPQDASTMHVDSEPVRTSKSIIFVLDEFDLFTTHPRQTLLYNLFDIAQSRKAPIAVIGCSTRMDVVESLEKRVKSRFSHRWLHLPSVKNVVMFEEVVRDALCVDEYGKGFTAAQISVRDQELRKRWNTYIQSCLLPSPEIQILIKRTFYTTKSLPDLFSALYIPIATLKLSDPDSDPALWSSSLTLSSTVNTAGTLPSLLTLLPSLSTLHLSLLIAAARLDAIHALSMMNFNLVYAHYADLIARSKLQMTAAGAVAVGASLRQWSRATARSAWEDLGSYEVIVPVSGGGVGTGAGGVMGLSAAGGKDVGGLFAGAVDGYGGESANVRMWRVDVTLEELAGAVKEKWVENRDIAGSGAKDVLAKWCREI